jgi:hypothetical protein
MVDDGSLVIEKLIGGGRFSFLDGELICWEDREDFNGIVDEIAS